MRARGGSRGRPADSRQPGRGRRVAAAALLWLSTTAQAAPDTLTVAAARALPVAALARRVLGASGVLIQSTYVTAGVGMLTNPHRLAGVVLASAPRSAGFPGLCVVDTYTAHFRPVGDAPGQDFSADLPSQVVALDRATRFLHVDAGLPPARGWDETYGKAMDAACAGTGPALRPDGTSPFFAVVTDNAPDARGAAASTALAVIAAAATPGPGVALVCETNLPEPCQRQIQSLARSAPDEVSSAACEQDPRRRCVEARYDRGWLHWLTLRVESDAGQAPTAYDSPPAVVRAIRIDEVQAIE